MQDDKNTLKFNVNDFGFDPTYGYTLDQLLNVPAPRQPKDYVAFWQNRYQKSLQQKPQPQIKALEAQHPDWRVFLIRYQSTDNFPIQGWLLLPKTDTIKRGFIIGHGYGGREGPDYHLPFKDAALLFPCFRGLSLSAQAGISTDPGWHVLHDIDKQNRYIIGGCVEDIWVAVSALLTLCPNLAGHLGYLGISFAGGIGAMALAWDRRIARGHLNVPTFGHQGLRLKLPTQGSANSVQQYYKTHKKQTLKVLHYYDAALSARHITQPMQCACAQFDPCVAPPGQFAIYNALPGEKQLMVLEAGHYNYPKQAQQERLLLEQLNHFFAPLGRST